MTEYYRGDLAYIHDVGHGEFARSAAPRLLQMLKDAGIGDGLVVDLGCGSGIWASSLVEAGYDVLGIDISASMLALARKRAPAATFRRGSLLSAKLPGCAAVTSIGECVSYLFDDRADAESLSRLFRRVHDALCDGGLFIFDVLVRSSRPRVSAEVRHAQGADWAVLLRVEHDPSGGRLTRHITSFRKVGKLYRRDEETHVLRLYERSQVVAELRRTGFRVRTWRGYGGLRFKPNHIAIVARKA